jgi:TolB-like protein/DNA-binding winged helix-turn-helix (wHTH) protein
LTNRTRSQSFCFGPYEVHPRSQELFKHGVKLKVRPQALRLMTLLLRRPGEVVTREEIREELWSAETFVDFEHSLNAAVKSLRGTLSDSATEPRYIETLPKIGYRFVAPVTVVTGAPGTTVPEDGGPESVVPATALPEQLRAGERGATAATAAATVPSAVRNLQVLWLMIAAATVVAVSIAAYYSHVSAVRERPPAAGGRTVLAVLPFQNLTGGADEEYFSDGLTEELISECGRLDPAHLGVIARTSVMHYKHSDESLDKIGRELGVQYALEGSVRRDADKVRISAQLIEVKDQTRLWSREYDRELKDLLALQSEIANDIGFEMQLTLGGKRREEPAKAGASSQQAGAESTQAYDLYLKGLYFWNKRSPADFRRAADYFQQCVEKDANYAQAYAGLAESYILMSGFGAFPPGKFIGKAQEAARRGVEVGDRLAETHTARALVAQDLDWDWATAEKEYRRAIELNPNYATAHHWYAEYLALMGRFAEAEAQIEQARVLDPLSLIIATDHGVILYYAREYDRAIAVLRAVREMDPAYPRSDAIDHAYIASGRNAEALADLGKFPGGEHEEPWFWGQKAYLAGRMGQTDEARKARDRLLRMNGDRELDPIVLATAELGLGEKQQAIEWLKKAQEEHSVSLTGVKVDPLYDTVREDERFQTILRMMNFPR